MGSRTPSGRLSAARRLPVLVGGLCAVVVTGCGQAPAPTAAGAPEQPVLRCEVLTVSAQTWPTIVRVPGSLLADETAVVGAKVAGRVAEVNVELGDTVSLHAPLATLDREEFLLQVAQAQAQLQQARAAVGLEPDEPLETLVPENAPPVREAKAVWDEAQTKSKRWRELRQRNAVSESDFEQVMAAEQVAAAQYAAALNGVHEKIALIGVRAAELSLAQQRLADTVVPAPFQGLVRERHVAPGSFVQVGQPIATIVRIDPLHFRGMMPERHARRLALGQGVRLRIEAVAETQTASVTRISPSLDPLSRALLFEAEVANPDGRLRSGVFAEADVTVDADALALVVPDSAVVEFAGVEKVWKVVDGTAQEQVVLTGERRDGRVEIVSGISAGDVLLVDGSEGRVARVEPMFLQSADPSLTGSPKGEDAPLAVEATSTAIPGTRRNGGAQ